MNRPVWTPTVFTKNRDRLLNQEQFLVYIAQALVIIVTMAIGIITVPSLTSAIFSGHASHGGGAL
jgi:hypothetical protein